jgi:hypothetical protein
VSKFVPETLVTAVPTVVTVPVAPATALNDTRWRLNGQANGDDKKVWRTSLQYVISGSLLVVASDVPKVNGLKAIPACTLS